MGLDTRLASGVLSFAFFLFFFFFFPFLGTRLRRQTIIVHTLFMNSSSTIWLFNPFSTHQWVLWTVPGTHKSHFSVIFSLKINFTVLFTHLKIILLQCFQFSVSAKYVLSKRKHKRHNSEQRQQATAAAYSSSQDQQLGKLIY